jgi:transposase, IS30 family
MGKAYKQLTQEERYEIARLRAGGATIRKIATALDRPASTVSRELKRNSGREVGYKASYAQEQASGRRWRGNKLVRQPELQREVLGLLEAGLSPEQICGRLKLERGRSPVSHETIYRFIDQQIRRTKDYRWRHFLPRGKSKRGLRGRKGGSSAVRIKNRVSIEQRPLYIERRRQPGHWEGDLLMLSDKKTNVLVAEERTSRFVMLAAQPDKSASRVARNLLRWFRKMPPELRRTFTQDNGTEFAQHFKLTEKLAMQTYFCNPHSPWQKGGLENMNGRLRRYIPLKTDPKSLTRRHIRDIAHALNHTPRKCLGFKTPAEVFFHKLLHFECESTFPPPRE